MGLEEGNREEAKDSAIRATSIQPAKDAKEEEKQGAKIATTLGNQGISRQISLTSRSTRFHAFDAARLATWLKTAGRHLQQEQYRKKKNRK